MLETDGGQQVGTFKSLAAVRENKFNQMHLDGNSTFVEHTQQHLNSSTQSEHSLLYFAFA